MAAGHIVVGVVKLWEKRSRLGGLGSPVVEFYWLLCTHLRARIGGEDNPKLTGGLRIMAFSGLLLIGAGLVALGVVQLAVADPPVTVDVPA